MYTRISFDCPFCDRPKEVEVDVDDEVRCPTCGRLMTETELKDQEATFEDPSDYFDDFSDANPGL